ncbi:hypothetical protein BT69DRAFT_1318546 [Atractiella rhizophila]|nr:hypothetical protein BT69DRAFT_1318546 [Atractiella rhizophila]
MKRKLKGIKRVSSGNRRISPSSFWIRLITLQLSFPLLPIDPISGYIEPSPVGAHKFKNIKSVSSSSFAETDEAPSTGNMDTPRTSASGWQALWSVQFLRHVYHHAFAATVVLLADMFESIENGVPPPILEEKRRTLLLAEDIFVPDRIPGQNLNHLVTQVATAIEMLLDSVQVKNSVCGHLEALVSDCEQGGSKARELQQAAAVTASCHLPPIAHLYHHLQPFYRQTHYSDSTKDFRELLTEDIKHTQATGGSIQTFEYALESKPFQQHDPVGVEGTQIPLTVPSSVAPVPLPDYHPQQQLTYAIQSPYNFPANPSHFMSLYPNQEQYMHHTSDHDLSPAVQV